ncbi:hypothetical protein JOC86_004502 [Bacillus pakistanensis]|uniref:HNH endonuclease n=1 Tax=Rossellomorea pakistanensis TaxID=992288 RepID=A0ABS2NJ77_9BACI|nr:hypothetical protein [Bacillus pakistanensis]MBM7587927.1 hypothetical protein [Bacillus pakistanensis]
MIKKGYYKRCTERNCRRRGLLLHVKTNFFSSKTGRFNSRATCKECFMLRHGKKMEMQRKRRGYLNKVLPNTLTDNEEVLIRQQFQGKCALSWVVDDVVLDHFVPLSWEESVIDFGLGGTTYANMLPLNNTINKSKSAENPFEWIKKARTKFNIDLEAWNAVVKYLADKHQMSVVDFESKVNECYFYISARRSVEWLNEVLRDKKRKPYGCIKGLLSKGINIEIAVDEFGSTKAKEYIKSLEGKNEIKRMKENLRTQI